MSSLIFYTDKDQAFVATDTLSTLYDGTPLMFTTKAFIVPHLRLIMCGTGVGGFVGRWFIQVNDKIVVRDIDHLDSHTPNNLMAFWQRYKEEFSIPPNLSTTVYYFGFSQRNALIHSYAYRSKNDFKSEALEYGVGFRPECQVPKDSVFPIDIKKMMDDQRSIQVSLPKDQRLNIGGEILIHHLTKVGFSVYTLGQFEDFGTIERKIFENFPNL